MNEVGDRVRLALDAGWTAHARAYADGKFGTVREIKTTHNNGREVLPIAPKLLVELDVPIPPVARGFSPMRHVWVEAHEVGP